jgi:uncharacterized membrane protein
MAKPSKLERDLKKAVKTLKNRPEGIKAQTHIDDAEKQVEKLSDSIFQLLSKKVRSNKKNKLTLGQKTADMITKWAGSWTFIIGFFVFLTLWMILNTYYWMQYMQGNPFDPYPFILLNLVLSCLAAIQAPVILMSQNRQGQKDRLKAEYDYQVNRKAEREIREIKIQLSRIEQRLK